MKKYIYIVALLSVGSLSAQDKKVGINTTQPEATLTVNALDATDHLAGLQAPRINREELTALGDVYNAEHTGTLIYITDVNGGNAEGQRALMTEVGYYYFDGNRWERAVSTAEYKNLYIKDGTLTSDRVVTQNAKTLTFEKTTGLTSFESADGTSPLQIIDGKQGEGMVLMSDIDGNAQWEVAAVPRVEGVFSENGGSTVNGSGTLNRWNTNAYIDLPAGLWAVSMGSEINFVGNIPTANTVLWSTIALGTNNVDTTNTRTTDSSIGRIQSFAGTGNGMNTTLFAAGPLDPKLGKNNMQGAAIIRSAPAAGQQTQRFYFYIGVSRAFLGSLPTATTYQMANYFKKDSPNSYLYAIRIIQ